MPCVLVPFVTGCMLVQQLPYACSGGMQGKQCGVVDDLRPLPLTVHNIPAGVLVI
jgi:hypothetical protein